MAKILFKVSFTVLSVFNGINIRITNTNILVLVILYDSYNWDRPYLSLKV